MSVSFICSYASPDATMPRCAGPATRARFISSTLAAVVLLAVVGCADRSAPREAGPILAAVSIVPQIWLIEQIGGEQVSAVALVQPGDSPATYAPTDAQVSRVMHADVYFRIGVPFENGLWFDALASSSRVRIVDVREGIERRPMAHDHAHDGRGGCAADGFDPHIWLSPKLLKEQAATMTRSLQELAPEHAALFRERLERLQHDLDELDAALRERFAPYRGRAFFVFHPSWGYFAEDYGLRQIAIEQEGKEPTDQELTALQRRAREEGVRVIFVQPQNAGRGAAAVAQAIGARVERLDPLAKDIPENLRHVAEAIARSFEAADSDDGQDSGVNR